MQQAVKAAPNNERQNAKEAGQNKTERMPMKKRKQERLTRVERAKEGNRCCPDVEVQNPPATASGMSGVEGNDAT
jgi:hypothetical protein